MQYGLLVGGGNSKNQPEWSSFAIRDGGEVFHIPDSALIETDGESARATFSVGGRKFRIVAEFVDERAVALCWTGPESSVGRVPLRLGVGTCLKTAAGETIEVHPDAALSLDAARCGRHIDYAGIRIRLPESYVITWPVRPFNPYTKDGRSPIENAVAMVEFPLSSHEVRLVFEEGASG